MEGVDVEIQALFWGAKTHKKINNKIKNKNKNKIK